VIKVLIFGLADLVHTEQAVTMSVGAGLDVVLAAAFDPIEERHHNYHFVQYRPIRFRGRRFAFVKALETLANVARVRRLLRTIHPDIVNVQWVDDRAYYCARAGASPLVLSCWGTDINRFFSESPQDSEFRSWLAHAVSSASLVTADCTIVLERVDKLAGQHVRSRLWFFGIDFSSFEAVSNAQVMDFRDSLGIPRDAKVILSCRRAHSSMGQQFILEAFARLGTLTGVPTSVLVLKRHEAHVSPNDEVELQRTIQRLQIQEKVFWIDRAPRRDVPIHYAMADIVVNYPINDAVPVSFFEAAAARKVVVSCDLPAYRNLFRDAHVSVAASDSDALAEGLAMALTMDETTRQVRVGRALALARELGDESRNGEIMAGLFQELVMSEREARPARHRMSNVGRVTRNENR
jgi:glycosyltransferase involved in cell wall biosynthesis